MAGTRRALLLTTGGNLVLAGAPGILLLARDAFDHAPAPPARTVTVPAELRTVTVPAELRIIHVPAEVPS